MTHLLLRLFVKDYSHTQSPKVRAAVGTLASITGIGCNVLLFLFKLIAGLLSGSIAITADAFNNLSDAAASIATLIGFRMAQQPADRDHPYGHARYEYLAGLAVAALILLIGAELGRSSIEKLFAPEATVFSALTAGILLCSILVKLWMSHFFRTLGKHIQSQTLIATAADSRNDVIASLAVLMSCLVEHFWGWKIDGFAGLAVAIFILISGFGIAKETMSPLIGKQADRELLDRIHALILRHDKVLGIHDLLVHDYGPGQCFASVHVEISAEEDPLDSHDIIDDIERDALAELNVHLVIHYDPVLLNDDEQSEMRQEVENILLQISPELSVHDFRLIRYHRHTKIYFDLELPYGMEISQEDLQQQIEGQIGDEYSVAIHFDRKA